MSLRFIEIFHHKGKADEIEVILQGLPIIETWHYHLENNTESVTKVLLKSEATADYYTGSADNGCCYKRQNVERHQDNYKKYHQE